MTLCKNCGKRISLVNLAVIGERWMHEGADAVGYRSCGIGPVAEPEIETEALS